MLSEDITHAKRAEINQQTQANLEENERFQLSKTGFRFIDDHKGFRRGYTHGLLAYPGTGKTSIIRALLKSLIKEHKVLLCSSEETKEQIEMKLLANKLDVDNVEKNLYIMHEREVIGDDPVVQDWANALEFSCMTVRPDILIYDNITTSSVYTDIRNALPVTNAFQRIATKFNIPVLVVYHTSSAFKENSGLEISANDVRGNKDAVNKMEYLYGLQRHSFESDMGIKYLVMTAKILKCRMHDTTGDVYKLNWHVENKEYENDEFLKYSEFKEFLRKASQVKKK